MTQSINIVTVCYSKDISLLKTQAQSIDLYVDPSVINQIVVVVNDEESIASSIDKYWYGQHCNKVVIKHRSTYGEFLCHGWESQQLCKLLASAESTVDWVLVLDTKTWFVAQYDLHRAFNHNKVAVDLSRTFADTFASVKTTVETLFDIKVPLLVGPTGVPFYFNSHTVRNMIKKVEELTNEEFTSFFINNSIDSNGNTAITEFHLYLAYIIYAYKDYSKFYTSTRNKYHNININDVNIADFKISNFNAKNLLTVGVHTTAYNLLDASSQQKWINFLNSKGLDNISYPNVN